MPAIGALSPHLDRHDLGGKLDLVAETIGLVSGARDQTQEEKQTKTQLPEKSHMLGR
jgi:hypothetical protein